eukprot:1605756-Rhodomonas_salina.1
MGFAPGRWRRRSGSTQLHWRIVQPADMVSCGRAGGAAGSEAGDVQCGVVHCVCCSAVKHLHMETDTAFATPCALTVPKQPRSPSTHAQRPCGKKMATRRGQQDGTLVYWISRRSLTHDSSSARPTLYARHQNLCQPPHPLAST